MWTLKEKLDYLEETKLQIKQAIIEKGIEVNDKDTFRSYVDKIREIKSSEFIMPQGMKFKDSTMTEIPMMNTNNITDMTDVFNNCNKLLTIPELNFSNVTLMSRTFYNCSSMVNIPFIDTFNVINMDNAFYGCTSLKRIESIDFRLVDTVDGIFTECNNITYLNIIGLGTSPNIYTYDFSDISKWGDANIETDARTSLLNTFQNNICDRKSHNMNEIVTLKLHKDVEKRFTQELKNSLTKKGYKISVAP